MRSEQKQTTHTEIILLPNVNLLQTLQETKNNYYTGFHIEVGPGV
jgi:NifB/MoaA-like Fe-S oxidoreductase